MSLTIPGAHELLRSAWASDINHHESTRKYILSESRDMAHGTDVLTAGMAVATTISAQEKVRSLAVDDITLDVQVRSGNEELAP